MVHFNKNEYLIFATILICCICYHIEGLGYSYGSTWQRLTYLFAHVGLLHLTVNIISFSSLSLALRNTNYVWLAFPCAIAATYGSELYVPTVGLSGVCYALLGIHTALSGKWIKIGLTAALYNFIIWAVSDNVNVSVHCLSYAYAILVIACIKLYHKVSIKKLEQLFKRI